VRILLLILICTLGACEAAPDPLEIQQAPDDFTIDVTVQGPPEILEIRARRPGRYIVEPDGILRAGVGAGVSVNYYPPQTRQLSRAEVERLWRLVRDSALLDKDNPDLIRPGLPFPPIQLRPTAQVALIFEGRRYDYRVLLDAQSPSAESAEGLIDHLAALAWLEP
jgi:hypothetical protein